MNIIRNLTFAALAATLLIQTPIMRADDRGAQRISFLKCWDPADGKLKGPVAGDCGVGTVVYTDTAFNPGKAIWHFSGEYIITTSACSFIAVCSGILDPRSGHIVLNGTVTAGDFLGAQVHVRAQANSTLTCTEGTMTITPRK